jgi:hypothetical protein
MKRAVQIGAVLVLLGLAFWLWTVLFPSPEKVIRARLNALAHAISFKANGGLLSKAYNAQKAADFFTPDVQVEVNVTGYDPIVLHGRDEVLQIAMAAHSRLTSLKVEFPDMNITVGADGQTAKVNLTGKATVPGERDISAQEFNFMLKKTDGKWLIYQVETVKTLSDISGSGSGYQVSGLRYQAGKPAHLDT